MERQAGLGRSLEDVLDALAPVDADPSGPGRVLFEPEAVGQQLDQLMGDVAALRERVQHLVGLVPEEAVLKVVPSDAAVETLAAASHPKSKKKSKKHKSKNDKKKKKKKKKAKAKAKAKRSAGD